MNTSIPATEVDIPRNPDDSVANNDSHDSTQTPWHEPDENQVSVAAGIPHTLNLRFVVLNVVAFGLLGAAWANGLVAQVMVADATRLSLLIFVVFLGGLMLCACRVFQVNQDILSLQSDSQNLKSFAGRFLHDIQGLSEKQKSAQVGSLRLQLTQRIVLVRYIANTLVLLGLIGTVVGFIIALSGVNPEDAKDVNAIAPMVSTLIAGMSTALYTTLVGSVLNLWLMANYQILTHGTVQLISKMITLPEITDARS